MRRSSLFQAAIVTAATLGLVVPAMPASAAASVDQPGAQAPLVGVEADPGKGIAHRLLLGWAPGASEAERAHLLDARGWDLEASYDAIDVAVVTGVANPSRAAASLADASVLRYAEPDGVSYLQAPTDEPSFSQLWGLQNTGQVIGGQTGIFDVDIDAPEAWATTIGDASAVVAVLDSGLDPLHPEFTGRVFTNSGEIPGNGVDDDANGFIDDRNGWDFISNDRDPSPTGGLHGTHVAGTIAASVDNAGIVGVAPGATIMPLRVCDTLCPFSAQLGAINYAAANGADIANMSLGGASGNNAVRDAIMAASNVTFAIAAGNETNDNDVAGRFPCNYPASNIVCVAATDNRDQLASFSNFGATTVDVAAPGVDIFSSLPAEVSGDTLIERFDGAFTWTPSGGIAPPWGTTTSFVRSPANALTDSPGVAYPNNQSSTVRSPAFALPASPRCTWQSWIALDSEYGFDFVQAFVAVGGVETTLLSVSGPVNSYDTATLDVTAFAGQTVQLGYRFITDGSVTGAGAFIDDVTVRCGVGGITPRYGFLNGTSMATPHVAGVLALMKSACPTCTPSDLKSALMNTVDPVAALSGRTVTGGRVNAASAVAAVSGTPPIDGITAVVPASVPPGSVANLQIQGSGFTGAISVGIPGVELLAASLVSDTVISADVIVGDGASAGPLSVSVSFPSDQFSCTNCLSIGPPVVTPICDGIGGRTVFVGTPSPDDRIGTAGGDVFCGFDGDDTFQGQGGNDVIVGGFGLDELRGGDGDDDLRGGSDGDTLYGGSGVDDVRGGGGFDGLSGAAGDDLLIGGSGGDLILGVGGDDDIRGGAGDDLIRGGDGGDSILGQNGRDQLFGEAGADLIDSNGGGSDFVRGGSQPFATADDCDRDGSDDVAGCEILR